MQNLKKILFFEPEIAGHQLDHIEHLCDYYSNNVLPFNIFFIVHNVFFQKVEKRGKKKYFRCIKNKGFNLLRFQQRK